MKKLAQEVRKSNTTVVGKYGDGYFVTDTYTVAFLDKEELESFIVEYNSYKSTSNIPFDATELDEDESYVSKYNAGFDRSNSLKIGKVITPEEDNREVLDDSLKQGSLTLLLFEGGVVSISTDSYERMKDLLSLEKWDVRVTNQLEPVKFYSDGELKAMVMPNRNESLPSTLKKYHEEAN